VVTLVAHGCPLQASVGAFGFDARTVADGIARAGEQCRAVHEQVVEQPRALRQVQADELRVKVQGAIVKCGAICCPQGTNKRNNCTSY
jgi:hypothetical protein